MLRKFVGDKASIEATSRDGRLWEIHYFDRGHLTKFFGRLRSRAQRHGRQEADENGPRAGLSPRLGRELPPRVWLT